jgi:hypothetical protein
MKRTVRVLMSAATCTPLSRGGACVSLDVVNAARAQHEFAKTIRMSKVILGLIGGVVFGALDVALMLPMSFSDKTTVLLGAFISRFAIGFVIGCVQLPSWPGWLVGLLFGLLISLPDAIITQKYVPILVLGGIGGLIIGGLIHGWRVNI